MVQRGIAYLEQKYLLLSHNNDKTGTLVWYTSVKNYRKDDLVLQGMITNATIFWHPAFRVHDQEKVIH